MFILLISTIFTMILCGETFLRREKIRKQHSHKKPTRQDPIQHKIQILRSDIKVFKCLKSEKIINTPTKTKSEK